MFNSSSTFVSAARWRFPAMAAIVFIAATCQIARAQVYNSVVGGISIDTAGALQNASTDAAGALAKQWAGALEQIPGDLNNLTELRKVSLHSLESAIVEAQKNNKELPDAVKYLAGLQQVRYVFVYPAQGDIVLAGPGEGWKVDARGNVVGKTTGKPTLLLDDLLVALRGARQAAQGGISCSINPTSEGLTKLRTYVNTLSSVNSEQEAGAIAVNYERLLGPQQISISGVPDTSHFARVLVAADYRMKRIAMDFEPAPVKGLPSYLQMMPAGSRAGMNSVPRWWLEPKYEAVVRDEEGLAWELRGASVKALSEESFVDEKGNKKQTGKATAAEQKWADLMTEKYDQLATADPVFGQLQNCMDLALVGALIVKERMTDRINYNMPVLTDETALKTVQYYAPKQVASQASLLKKGTNWVISASGGVMINSWVLADKPQKSEAPGQIRAKTAPNDKSSWWWN
jgi:hypothetical protein